MTPAQEAIETPLPVAYWSLLGDAFFHPLDAPRLDPTRVIANRLPQPWTGPLSRADVFVLFGNPGSEGTEDSYEAANPEFAQALRDQLTGEANHVFLDPRFADHPGWAWMYGKFGADLALRDLADRLCTIELFPYAGEDNDYGKSVSSWLPSSVVLREWVHEDLVPRTLGGEVAMFVMRAARAWGFTPGDREGSLYVAPVGQSQGAYLTAATEAGVLLRQWLRDHPRS